VARQLLLYWEKNFLTLSQCVEDTKGRWNIQREVRLNLDPNLIEGTDGNYLHHEVRCQLQATLNSWGMSKASVHCFLPAERIFLKTILLEIPSGLEDSIPRLVRLEAKKVFPVPLEELIWNFHIFPSDEKKRIPILYAATKRKFMDPLMEMILPTELNIQTITSTSHALYEAYQRINHNSEITLIIDINTSFTNLTLIKSQAMLINYTLDQKKEESSLLEKIETDTSQILEYATSQKITPTQIVITGGKEQKKQLLLLLQQKHPIPIKDLDQLLLNHLSLFTISADFLGKRGRSPKNFLARIFHTDRDEESARTHGARKKHIFTQDSRGTYSSSQNESITQYLSSFSDSVSDQYKTSRLVGASTFFKKENHIKLNLLPPSLIAQQQSKKQLSYILQAIALLTVTLILWSLYFQHETRSLIKATSQTRLFLEQEEKKILASNQLLANFQKVEEKKTAWCNLLEVHAFWPRVIQELQKTLPKRYIWVTKCYPNDDDKDFKETNFITFITVEGLYLENQGKANMVDEFVENLKKSDFFKIKKREEIVLLCSPNDGSSYTYPWKLRLPLQRPISFDLENAIEEINKGEFLTKK
jgi:hypothetical protein